MGLNASKKNRASSPFEEIGWSGISVHPNAAKPQVKGERVKVKEERGSDPAPVCVPESEFEDEDER